MGAHLAAKIDWCYWGA